jgi:hypothetical protein
MCHSWENRKRVSKARLARRSDTVGVSKSRKWIALHVLSVQPNNLGHDAVQLMDEIIDGVCQCEGIEVSIR